MYARINSTIILMVLILSPAYIAAEIIAEDNFESGTAKSFWGTFTSVEVSSVRAKDGEFSLRFSYPGVDPEEDGWAEARFDLGMPYAELTITYDLYIPENYEHRDAPGAGDNNKFLRIWSTSYDDEEKLGASMYNQESSGESLIGSDYRREPDWGMSSAVTHARDFITSSDRGTWMDVEIHIKAATDDLPAQLRIYKNRELHLVDDNIDINYIPGVQGYRYGYLMGWANTGYSEDTFFYIDNVTFHDQGVSVFSDDFE